MGFLLLISYANRLTSGLHRAVGGHLGIPRYSQKISPSMMSFLDSPRMRLPNDKTIQKSNDSAGSLTLYRLCKQRFNAKRLNCDNFT